MASFAGLRGTGSWGTDERPKNFRETILWLNPRGSAPLFALMAKMAKESVNDPEFNWWEERMDVTRLTMAYATGFSTTDNTLTIAAGGCLALVAGNLLQVEKTEDTTYSNEIVMVSSVTSDTVVVVKRGIAGSTAVPILATTYLTKIGNSHPEGDTSADISQRNPTKLNNYCQIFRTSVGITGTAGETFARTGDAWVNDKKRKAFDHSSEIEWGFLYGKKYEDTTGTYPRRYTGGIRQFLQTNVKIYSTTPTEDDFLDFVSPIFDYNTEAGDERIVLCGNGFLNSLNKLARNSESTRINFDKQLMDVYGMSLQRWTLPQGTLGIKTHPLMNRHPRYKYSAFILDMANIKYRPLRDTRFKDNIQANDADLRKGEWLTEAGIELRHELTQGYVSNFVV